MLIVTHDGPFHSDDVLSTVILREILEGTINRTRKNELIEAADIIYDVGGIYDRNIGRFDHHFRSRPKRPSGESYSTLGLIWKEFGRQYIAKLTGLDINNESEDIDLIWSQIDENFIKSIDMYDNGEGQIPNHFTLAYALENFNPNWDDNDTHNKKFWMAVNTASHIFKQIVLTHKSIIHAKKVIESSTVIDDQILYLNELCPWQKWIFDLGMTEIKFVIYQHRDKVNPETGETEQQFRVQAVPTAPRGKVPRRSFPEEWGGLSGDALEQLSGINGITFCHKYLYLAGCNSKEAAIETAKILIADSADEVEKVTE